MSIFKKKTTLIHHITYMGVMAAVNLLFIVLDTYTQFMMLLLVFLLPFTSTVVSYYCLKRYYPIYAVASIGLCLIFNPTGTIFYVVPALITGFLIGLFLEKGVNPFWIVLCSTIIETGLSFAFIPLINFIGKTDVINSIFLTVGLGGFEFKTHLVFLVIYFMALVQCSLTHFVLFTDIKKIGIEVNTGINTFAPYIIGLLVSLIISLVFALTYEPLSLLFIAIAMYFGVFLFANIIVKAHKLSYILMTVFIVISFFGFALLYKKVNAPLGIWFVSFFPLSIAITSFVDNYLLKGK